MKDARSTPVPLWCTGDLAANPHNTAEKQTNCFGCSRAFAPAEVFLHIPPVPCRPPQKPAELDDKIIENLAGPEPYSRLSLAFFPK